MTRILLVWFAFFGVFAAGAVTGGMVATRFYRSVIQKRASEQFTQQQFKRVADQLGLTAEQRERIRPIITSSAEQIQAHRRENLNILERMEVDVRAQLTAEQQAKFDDLRARQRDNERVMQRWLKEQRNRRQEWMNRLSHPPATSPADSTPPEPQADAPAKPAQ